MEHKVKTPLLLHPPFPANSNPKPHYSPSDNTVNRLVVCILELLVHTHTLTCNTKSIIMYVPLWTCHFLLIIVCLSYTSMTIHLICLVLWKQYFVSKYIIYCPFNSHASYCPALQTVQYQICITYLRVQRMADLSARAVTWNHTRPTGVGHDYGSPGCMTYCTPDDAGLREHWNAAWTHTWRTTSEAILHEIEYNVSGFSIYTSQRCLYNQKNSGNQVATIRGILLPVPAIALGSADSLGCRPTSTTGRGGSSPF